MKILLLLLLAVPPAGAQWGAAESRAAADLISNRADISIIGGVPLLDLLAARDKAYLPLTIAGVNFLASFNFDADWNAWFTLKPADGGLGAGAWEETALAAGTVYKYKELALHIKGTSEVITIGTEPGEKTEIPVPGLYDRLYKESFKFTFGELNGSATYAVFRNLAPLSEEEGTVTLRIGSDGLYYYSLTPDKQITAAPRWLLAINHVLYGLKITDSSLFFVSKPIEMTEPRSRHERAYPR